MTPMFGDTVYFIALLSIRDRWHVRATEIQRQPPRPLLTTEWVLLEVVNAFCQPAGRMRVVRLIELLGRQDDVEIVPASRDWFQRGLESFAARPDKEWSLTDCISFVVMKERGVSEALTNDHHFEQAGWRILLKG